MLHLRTDWQGIQDVRQWVLPELEGIEALLDDENLDDAGDAVTALVDRLRTLAGIAKDAETLPDAKSSIEDDELVFIVRAKTRAAFGTVMRYAQLASIDGADAKYCTRIKQWAKQMQAQRDENIASGHWTAHAPDAPELLPLPEGFKAESELTY